MEEGFIFGCSAQGRVALSILKLQYPETTWYFVDDNAEMHGREVNGATVFGDLRSLSGKNNPCIHLALGNPNIKIRIAERCREMNLSFVQAIHPSAIVCSTAQIGRGVLVGAGAIINTEAVIGDFALINTGVIIEHDTTIGAFTNVSPGACIGGRVNIGNEAFIGSGAIILARTNVGYGSVIGMGATVTRDIPEKVLAYGVPARIIREIDENFDWKKAL